MKHRILHSLAIVFLALALTARAAEEAPEQDRYRPLPEGIVAHISVENAKELLDNAFRYTGEATKDTPKYIPGEVLGMLLSAYSPLPMNSWNMDNEAHAIFVGDFSKTPVLVFPYNSFDELLAGLEKAKCTIGEKPADIGETDFADVRTVSLPRGRTFFLADLGTGWAVAAEDFEDATFAALNPDWDIIHLSGAGVFARIAVPASGAGISEKLLEAFTGDAADKLAEGMARIGLTPEVAAGITEMAEKYAATIGDELEKLEEIQFELDFDDGNLILSAAARFADGSWARHWADTMDAAESAPDTGMTVLLPEGALSVAAAAPMAEFIPGLQAIYAAFAPDFADAFFALNPGTSVSGSYFNSGNRYQLSVTEIDDAPKALELLRDACAAASGILERSFTDPSESLSLVTEKQTDGEREWYALRVEPADAEKFTAYLARLNAMNPGRSPLPTELDPDFRFYMAELEGTALVTLFGPVPQDDFAEILKNIAETPADAVSVFDSPDAENALDSVDDAQLSVGLIDPNEAHIFYAVRLLDQQQAKLTSSTPESEALFDAQIQAIVALVIDPMPKAAPAAFGMGGEDGNIVMSLSVPPATVRAFLQSSDRLRKNFMEAAKKTVPEAE